MRRAMVAVVLGTAALVLLAPEASAQSKSYHFPRVEIDATINPDGSLDLVERRTFDFRGDFSFAFFTIEPQHAPPDFVRDFTVTDGGRELEVDETVEAGGFKGTWYFDAHDELKTFRISYTVLCAVDVYDDAAHLLWQFVGSNWTERTDLVRVTAHVPERATGRPERQFGCEPGEQPAPRRTEPLAPNDVRAWGHGPLAGEVRFLDPRTVRFTVRDLPPGQLVEGSILMPPESVAIAPVLTGGGPARERILAEEAALAEEADALRARHERETTFVKILFGLIPALMLGLVLLARLRDRVPGVPKMLQEPPEEIHPVQLALYWSAYRKRPKPKAAYRAQLLHVARTGALQISAIGRVSDPEDFQIRQRDGDPGDRLDREFMEFLFAGDGQGPVNLSQVDASGDRKDELKDWWNAVGDRTRQRVKEISKGKNRPETWLMALLGLGGAAFGLHRWTGFADNFASLGIVGPLAAWLIPVSLVSWVVARRLTPVRPKSPKTRERMAGWRSFRRFLKSFSSLDEAPALAVVVWEQYLVHAVALGVADEVEKQVKALVPEEELPEAWPDAPHGMGSMHWYHRWNRTPAYAPSAAAASVGWSSGWGSSSSSSGGFSGGGFSGGGGGGGGGTGGGAG